jgi:FtsP/CotA-like multicopper oxidase with cupredoxin domain
VAATPFPDATQYPKMPGFLADIDPAGIHTRRDITFTTMSGGKPGIGRGNGGPIHSINGKQFSNDDIDQIMALNSVEEWTLYNATPRVQHPFHIHVNPFQVVEVFDPSLTTQPVLAKPYVWWDTIAIPSAANGKNGYVKIRSRFADFVGLFVIHCHILAHEDRGMMQLIEVVSNKTIQKHYH